MRVLFGIDGSDSSDDAVRQVGKLLSPTDKAALFFAAPEVVMRHAPSSKELQARFVQSVAADVLAQTAALFPSVQAADVTKISTSHMPRDGILIEADNWGADLIVVGAKGMSTMDRLLLGSVSRAVALRSPIPVFVSRRRDVAAAAKPLKILVAYDGSSCSDAALKAAQLLTYPAGTEVVAVTTVDAPPADLPDWIRTRRSPETDEIIAHWRAETEADKSRARRRLEEVLHGQTKPFNQAEILVVEGHAAEQILKLIDERKIDLVVLGAGGKGFLTRLLIGSTSDKVLTHAPCSVLIAHSARG